MARVAGHGDVARVLVDAPVTPAWRARLTAAGAEPVEVATPPLLAAPEGPP